LREDAREKSRVGFEVGGIGSREGVESIGEGVRESL